MRLIDADKVCEILDDIDGFTFFVPESVKQLLEEVPTVEPKRGRWVIDKEIEEYAFKCTSCGWHGYGSTSDIMFGDYKFCPNCGARMEGENND